MRYVGLYKPTFVYWGPVRGCKRCLYLPEATHLLKGGIYTAADGTPGLANAIQASLRNGVTVAPTTLTRSALVRIQVPQPKACCQNNRLFLVRNVKALSRLEMTAGQV